MRVHARRVDHAPSHSTHEPNMCTTATSPPPSLLLCTVGRSRAHAEQGRSTCYAQDMCAGRVCTLLNPQPSRRDFGLLAHAARSPALLRPCSTDLTPLRRLGIERCAGNTFPAAALWPRTYALRTPQVDQCSVRLEGACKSLTLRESSAAQRGNTSAVYSQTTTRMPNPSKLSSAHHRQRPSNRSSSSLRRKE